MIRTPKELNAAIAAGTPVVLPPGTVVGSMTTSTDPAPAHDAEVKPAPEAAEDGGG